MKDYYYILGIKENATNREIKKAYRKLSMKYHPDKNPGDKFFEERFKAIEEAYGVLIDKTSKSRYDSQYKKGNGEESRPAYNFPPFIEIFSVDTKSIEYNKAIELTWKCLNANIVSIEPFGEVDYIGKKKYVIRNFDLPTIIIKLIATNTYINKSVESIITLNNATYGRLKEKIIQEYLDEQEAIRRKAAEEVARIERLQKEKLKKLSRSIYKSTTNGIKLEIKTNQKHGYVSGDKAYIDGSLAPSGLYNFSWMGSNEVIEIKDGIIIK